MLEEFYLNITFHTAMQARWDSCIINLNFSRQLKHDEKGYIYQLFSTRQHKHGGIKIINLCTRINLPHGNLSTVGYMYIQRKGGVYFHRCRFAFSGNSRKWQVSKGLVNLRRYLRCYTTELNTWRTCFHRPCNF